MTNAIPASSFVIELACKFEHKIVEEHLISSMHNVQSFFIFIMEQLSLSQLN